MGFNMTIERTASLVFECAFATGLTETEVLRIARNGPKRYKVYQIPKRTGGTRTICHPSRELKLLQYVFLNKILAGLPVHQAATAYKIGSSIRQNADVHKDSRVILKLDFEAFFPSIKTRAWNAFVKRNLQQWTREDLNFSKQVLFWGGGKTKPNCLSIGAPTSPLISNAIMYNFDCWMFEYANQNALQYTRYADDITLSSHGFLDKEAVILKVNQFLQEMKQPVLKLNKSKTKLLSKTTSRRVTGLILTNEGKVSLGRERKRTISVMVHKAITNKLSPEDLRKLSGLLSFAHDVERTFIDTLQKKYGIDKILKLLL